MAETPLPPASTEARQERRWLAAGAVVGVAVVGLVVLAVAVFSGGDGPTSGPAPSAASQALTSAPQAATLRDEALRAAEASAVSLRSLDFRTAAQDLDRWELTATGALLDDLRMQRASVASAVAQQRTVTTARVVAAGVSAVSVPSGTAEVLVVLEVSVAGQDGVTTTQARQKLTMTRTGQGWKPSVLVDVEPSA